MKNFKTLGFVAILIAMIIISSCSKEETASKSENTTVTKSFTVRNTDKTEIVIEDALIFVFSEDEERIVSLDFSEELEALFDEAGYGMDEIRAMIDEEFGASIYLPFDDIIEAMDAAGKTDTPFSDCIKSCLDTYEKGKGLGICKFGCFVDLFERLLDKLIDNIDISSDSDNN